ncbi:MAG: hypothetical protein KIT31_22470, partial [Deltaproteobacteria bacterium]|nr:hypothetical protein [Deltaproteobacteria bacterium]
MTSRELIAWAALYERRARKWWASRVVVAVVLGGAIAAWVAWRAQDGFVAGSRGWLVCATLAFALAFLRVPFHVYWRSDASLLAQLPIEGIPLFDTALVRCVRSAATTTAAVAIGALPLAREPELFARHLAIAGAFGVAAATIIPAIVVWTASLVALDDGKRAGGLIRAATTAAGAPPSSDAQLSSVADASSSGLLGAVPGAAGALLIILVLLEAPWLTHGTPQLPVAPALLAVVVVGVVAIAGIRRSAGGVMGRILRDVSALDRQRLATLEIHPPTALERVFARLAGDGALAYRKDARLVRRRYPLAFALGGLAFLILVGVGIAVPDDPLPWLTTTIVAMAAYGVVLGGRLQHPPIELARLSASLPMTRAAIDRAKLVWVLGWWTVFALVPGVFAVLRQADAVPGLALLGGGTLVVAVASRLRA